MVRLCERPGCSQPGDVNYGIDPVNLVVWIESFDPEQADPPGVLCRRHADAMVVPLRWSLDDRRETTPRLFRVAAPAQAAVIPAAPRRPDRAAVANATVQLVLEQPVVEPAPAAPDEVTDADGTGSPWRPVFDPDDDLDGLLDATGPLLARAFAGRPRSGAPAR